MVASARHSIYARQINKKFACEIGIVHAARALPYPNVLNGSKQSEIVWRQSMGFTFSAHFFAVCFCLFSFGFVKLLQRMSMQKRAWGYDGGEANGSVFVSFFFLKSMRSYAHTHNSAIRFCGKP